MSAIAFSTKVEKEVDDKGVEWAVITLRGKWCVSSDPPTLGYSGLLITPNSQAAILSFLERAEKGHTSGVTANRGGGSAPRF